MNKAGHTTALNLNLLAGKLQAEVKDTMAFVSRIEGGWTQAEVDAMQDVLDAIKALDRASDEALTLSEK